MANEQDELDERLALLGRKTDGIVPRADFSARVMERIAAVPDSWLEGLRAPARRLLPLGLLIAVAAFGWAFSAQRDANEALATSDGSAELGW